MFSAPVYQGQAVRDRQNSQIRKTSLDSIHMDLDSYEVHEQEDIKSWLSCSQEMQPDAIEAVRRLSYDGATVKKCVRYPAPPSPPRAFATLPPGTGPTSWWVEPCNPSTTAALSPGRRSSIPLPRSHREMPAAKPRQDTFWTELPQSPRCPSYPCTPNSKPQQRSPSRPMVAEMAKRRQPSQIRRQGPEGDSSARDCVGDEESGVALPAPRYSKDQEVPIIQQDCRTEDETEDTIIEQLLSGDKSGLQGRGGDGGEEDRQDTWDKEVIKGSLLHPLVPPCLPPGVRRLNLPPRSDEIHHPAPIDAWALIKGSGAALMKNLQDSGLMPLEDTPRSGPAHSRQGSWPALGIVDAKMDAVEDMDVPMSSFTTYLQNNTLFTATDGALPPNTPLVSPRVDDDGENPYSPPTPYRLGYAPGNPATVRPFKMETSPRKNDPTGAGASQDAPKNIFGSLLSNVQMLVDSVHSRRPEKEEASHHRPPQEVEEEASGQEEEEEEETEASGEEAEEADSAAPLRSPPKVAEGGAAKDMAASEVRTLVSLRGLGYNTPERSQCPREYCYGSYTAARSPRYAAGMDSPRDCSISHILPMNSARSEYHAMQQQAIRESVDLADQGDVDGDQLSAQLRTLLCNSIIMCKEAPEEGAPDAPLAWHDDLHGDAEQRLLDRSLVEVPEKAMLTREAVKRAEWMSTGKFAVSREAWMAGECPWAGPGAQERDDFISEDPAAARENAAFPRNMRRTTADTNSTIETKNTGRTLSLIDMAESHPPQIEAPTPASTWKETEEDLGPTEEDAAQSEAERLAALRQELHRVLDLLIARPTHQQNSEQITKLQDLESTISVALEEMLVEDGRAKHSPQGSSAVETHQPVDRSSVSVSVDLTGDGTVRRLAEGDTAAKSRGGKSADQVGETFSDQTGQKRKWKLWRNHCVPIRALFCGCSSLPRESVAEEEPGMVTCRVGSAAY